MSDTPYKRQALDRFYEAAHKAAAARMLRLTIAHSPDNEKQAQRNALMELSARLIDAEITPLIELGIVEWYRAHEKEPPSPASSNVGSKHPG